MGDLSKQVDVLKDELSQVRTAIEAFYLEVESNGYKKGTDDYNDCKYQFNSSLKHKLITLNETFNGIKSVIYVRKKKSELNNRNTEKYSASIQYCVDIEAIIQHLVRYVNIVNNIKQGKRYATVIHADVDTWFGQLNTVVDELVNWIDKLGKNEDVQNDFASSSSSSSDDSDDDPTALRVFFPQESPPDFKSHLSVLLGQLPGSEQQGDENDLLPDRKKHTAPRYKKMIKPKPEEDETKQSSGLSKDPVLVVDNKKVDETKVDPEQVDPDLPEGKITAKEYVHGKARQRARSRLSKDPSVEKRKSGEKVDEIEVVPEQVDPDLSEDKLTNKAYVQGITPKRSRSPLSKGSVSKHPVSKVDNKKVDESVVTNTDVNPKRGDPDLSKGKPTDKEYVRGRARQRSRSLSKDPVFKIKKEEVEDKTPKHDRVLPKKPTQRRDSTKDNIADFEKEFNRKMKAREKKKSSASKPGAGKGSDSPSRLEKIFGRVLAGKRRDFLRPGKPERPDVSKPSGNIKKDKGWGPKTFDGSGDPYAVPSGLKKITWNLNSAIDIMQIRDDIPRLGEYEESSRMAIKFHDSAHQHYQEKGSVGTFYIDDPKNLDLFILNLKELLCERDCLLPDLAKSYIIRQMNEIYFELKTGKKLECCFDLCKIYYAYPELKKDVENRSWLYTSSDIHYLIKHSGKYKPFEEKLINDADRVNESTDLNKNLQDIYTKIYELHTLMNKQPSSTTQVVLEKMASIEEEIVRFVSNPSQFALKSVLFRYGHLVDKLQSVISTQERKSLGDIFGIRDKARAIADMKNYQSFYNNLRSVSGSLRARLYTKCLELDSLDQSVQAVEERVCEIGSPPVKEVVDLRHLLSSPLRRRQVISNPTKFNRTLKLAQNALDGIERDLSQRNSFKRK
jgi:hypothetical protein